MQSIVIAFACGIAVLQLQAVLPEESVIGLLAVLALAGIFLFARRRHWAFRAAALACYMLTGFVWAGMMAQFRLADQLPEPWETKDIELTGIVAALPQRFERGERFEFDVESVQTKGAVVPGRVMLSWYHGWDDLDEGSEDGERHSARAVRPGERWRFKVRLKRPHGNANPHGFDYEAWLLERNIRATGTIRLRGEAQRIDEFVMHPGYVIERLREVVRKRFVAAMPDAPYLGVLIALTVGDQRSIPSAQWKIFNRTGITHLVSISGLHVTMVAALFAALINGLWRRSEWLMLRLPAPKVEVAAGWLAAFAYTLLAGFEVPAQRTLYMLSVVALALWSGRHLGVSRTLLLALGTVLLLDPWAVLATGFWLSFGAVALLLFVGTARVGDAPGWRAALARWGVTQWAVTVGSLPLLLLFFQQFSLVSPLANALAIPVVSFVITPLALIFAALPWTVLLQADHWLLSQMMVLLEWLADWPMWQQAAPPLWAALLAVAGVVWLLLPRGFPARWLGACLLMPAFFWSPPRPAAGEAWVDVLDVGQGLAVVVRTAGHTLLYDTGPLYSADSNAGQRVIVPFLRAIGVGKLDALVVSHRDKDHAGGVNAVRESLPISRILTSITTLGGEPCSAGQNWEWDGVRFLILHPLVVDYQIKSKKSNNMSCVLRIAGAAGSVLLTADIEADDERALIARSASQLPSDVLLAPHHGGSGSSTAEFIAAVGARDVVFSAGYRNPFKHPRPDVLERYAASQAWRTDRGGAIHLALTGANEVSAWRSEHRRYWHGQ
ncbi:DNA internalization-related competence protein ComEC/Rec2 [Propionivibrio sp.]|uniref:DNA internalization-related competence protein ComEC/Rec2 n=1 Tax=Propionivibrio sp. TaxID=2212460 RepID=UPI0025F95815|nr:DNA internalization-related competence protein ComEC/Rec2 [Propionivibrio sp.]MBK8743661.1 DNA internalization-related competence protein ComEC/Rec2 [Propionivibrio sp.]MBK8894901.1 DNA internalization-related competence protein ComEC/Rec2 [Propionivibrio sp.]MBL0208462.1 DNA internalization-related competence protein ComEC/Rec2 [Propionivibrio sp.]